jgi:CHAD domain-containing protein
LGAARAEPTTDALHEWRKRVKDHHFHLRLLRELWPPVVKPVEAQAGRLGELLGAEHDLAVLGQTLADGSVGESELVQELAERIAAERASRREAAFALGARLYAQRPEAYGLHVRALWKASDAR